MRVDRTYVYYKTSAAKSVPLQTLLLLCDAFVNIHIRGMVMVPHFTTQGRQRPFSSGRRNELGSWQMTPGCEGAGRCGLRSFVQHQPACAGPSPGEHFFAPFYGLNPIRSPKSDGTFFTALQENCPPRFSESSSLLSAFPGLLGMGCQFSLLAATP